MLNTRHLFRIFSSQYNSSLMHKCATPIFQITKNSSLFLQKDISYGRYNFCTIPKNSMVENEAESKKKVLGKLEQKLRITFTCKRCSTRNAKTISKLSYETGIVIIRCDGCKNNHLVADNLGWFQDLQAFKNIEKFLSQKQGVIEKKHNYKEGCLEISQKKKTEDIPVSNSEDVEKKIEEKITEEEIVESKI